MPNMGQENPEERGYRWGEPLDFATADGLARRWNDGDVISETQRWRMFADAIMEYIDMMDKQHRYYTLGEIRQYMVEKGLLSIEADIDDNLLQHTVCEAQCAAQCQATTGPDADECFWPCMHECTPVGDAIPDTNDLLFTPSPVDPALVPDTFMSLPSGVIVPKNIRKVDKS